MYKLHLNPTQTTQSEKSRKKKAIPTPKLLKFNLAGGVILRNDMLADKYNRIHRVTKVKETPLTTRIETLCNGKEEFMYQSTVSLHRLPYKMLELI